MRLDRNNNDGGRGKYALVKLRRVEEIREEAKEPNSQTPLDDRPIIAAQDEWDRVHEALHVLMRAGVLDYGVTDTESEFFVIRLKDRNALPALRAYSDSVRWRDPEFALEVSLLCNRAGEQSQFCKDPD